MQIDPNASAGPSGPEQPDPAENQTESVRDEPSVDSAGFTDRGDEAESAAFRDEGAYSGGDFAGGHA
jgi:hypothetical protein